MTYAKYIIGVALLVVVAVVTVMWQMPTLVTGSVITGGEYLSTTTVGMSGHSVIAGNKQVTLGSVVVLASSSATTTVIWNATSTTDTASTTYATIPTSATAGTYTFDTRLLRGLVIDNGAGNTAEIVVTWRP